MTDDSPGSQVPEFIMSPLGGAVIALLFARTGCKVQGFTCPPGQGTNFLGWDMLGLVGAFDGVGLFLIGVVAAAVSYFVAHAIFSRSRNSAQAT